MGIQMWGVDPSQESVQRLLREGIPSFVGSIYSEISEEKLHSYDCLFLFEVAEHLLYPDRGIQNVRKLLKDDGYFIVSVPDYSQIATDESEIPNYFNLEHINYFSEVSLDNLMRRYGMQRVEQVRFGCDLIHCYRCFEGLENLEKDDRTALAIRTFFSAKEEKEVHIRSLIAQLKESQKEVIIWGTGSYVMSLLAETELKDCNILGFVDNNKLKQGKKIYGYDIYVPEFLKDKKVSVLICSMLNSKEIKIQLESMNTENKIFVI